jgi:hypothetical protein
MSDLTPKERRVLEAFLGMSSGYVLTFNDRTYARFFSEEVDRNIDDPRFRIQSGSKAWRMRSFWDQEENWVVAKCLTALLGFAHDEAWAAVKNETLVTGYQNVITRISARQTVADLGAITSESDDRNFDAVAKAAREAIEKNQPETGLDRLHTFVVKFFRKLCDDHGLQLDRNVPLNGLVGAYVKLTKEQGKIGSEMTERILKSSIAHFEAFNHVRNNHSMAHDNVILGYDEALLIFNHVASTVRYIKALEARSTSAATSDGTTNIPQS